MALITKKVYGTEDILPKDVYKWQAIEKIMREEAELYGFKEIRTPVFEHTELFKRGVGDTTDVVQKEMYTFDTKGGTSITLRPEGTAGSARAYLEHALYNDGLPVKTSYFVSCYRYEKKQAHRYREFHQFGLEVYGTAQPVADAELIISADSIFKRLQLKDIKLELNSIGCPECRKEYYKALTEHFTQHTDDLCETCLSRLDRNPMRILDCKSTICSKFASKAPTVLDYLCSDCKEHFESVKKYLEVANVQYTVNPTIVRGLDYYTRTVFEFVTDTLGTQGTVCGGGRYDGLIEELGGQHTPSLGFALGMERILAVMEAQNIELPQPKDCDIYIVGMGDNAKFKAFNIVKELRESSIKAESDIVGKSLRAQMKYADKINAKFSLVIGDNEIDENKAMLKNMTTKEQHEVHLDDNFIAEFLDIYTETTNKEMFGEVE